VFVPDGFAVRATMFHPLYTCSLNCRELSHISVLIEVQTCLRASVPLLYPKCPNNHQAAVSMPVLENEPGSFGVLLIEPRMLA
jgi:hypothetical protein